MEKRVNKGRPASGTATTTATATGERCSACGQPTVHVCQHCSGLTFYNGAVAYCPPLRRPDNPVVALTKTNKEEKPSQGAVGNSGTFSHMLRRGGKMMEQFSKNVASATDNLFGVDDYEEEDIDKLVEEFKKAQLEDKEKHNKF